MANRKAFPRKFDGGREDGRPGESAVFGVEVLEAAELAGDTTVIPSPLAPVIHL